MLPWLLHLQFFHLSGLVPGYCDCRGWDGVPTVVRDWGLEALHQRRDGRRHIMVRADGESYHPLTCLRDAPLLAVAPIAVAVAHLAAVEWVFPAYPD